MGSFPGSVPGSKRNRSPGSRWDCTTPGYGGFEERGHAPLALTAALMARERPEAEEAAVQALLVVDLLDSCPRSTLSANLHRTVAQFRAYGELGPVSDFRDALSTCPLKVLIQVCRGRISTADHATDTDKTAQHRWMDYVPADRR
jgi:hypothetical protein